MPSGMIMSGRGSASLAASLTLYGGYYNGQAVLANLPTTEADNQTIFQTAGVISNLYIRFQTYDRATGTITSRKGTFGGASNGAMSASITGSGEFTDASNTDTVAAGDYANYKLVTGSGGTTSIMRGSGGLFAPTANVTISKWGFYGGTGLTGNATYYQCPCTGTMNLTAVGSSAESLYQLKLKMSGTWRNLWTNVSANTVASTGTLKSRLNTANGGQSASITASTTGHFEDTSGTDSCVVDDLLSLQQVAGTSAGTLTIGGCGSEFQGAANQQTWVMGGGGAGLAVVASATRNISWGGTTTNDGGSGTETDISSTCKNTANLSLFGAFISANTLTAGGVTTIKLRISLANATAALSNTAQTTGYLVDTTHQDTILPTNLTCIQVIAPAGGTSISINNAEIVATPPFTVHHKVIQ